ncbi:hypothetical protein RFI_09489, partial [Reticulomyxa filosa]
NGHTLPQTCRSLIKVIRLVRDCVNCLQIINDDIIVVGCKDGSVKFFDFEFRVIGWVDKLADEVISISFPLSAEQKLSNQIETFVLPSMLLCTKNSSIFWVNSKKSLQTQQDVSDGEGRIVKFDTEAIQQCLLSTLIITPACFDIHPKEPKIYIGTYDGKIEIWDYLLDKKCLSTVNVINNKQILVKNCFNHTKHE